MSSTLLHASLHFFLGNEAECKSSIKKNIKQEESAEGERRRRRKAKSKYSTMEDDDLEKMLKWKNGIGTLPGKLSFSL